MPDPKLDADGNPINPDPNTPGSDDNTPLPDGGQPGGGGGDEPEPSFSKKQMEQLATLVGRISKKQLEEHVLPLIPKVDQAIHPQNEDALKKFNEDLQSKIFSGDVMGAFRMMRDVEQRATTHITEQQKTQTAKALTEMSEKPFYKEIYADMKKIAEATISEGYPPKAAAEYAYYKAKADFLEQKVGGGEEGRELGFVEGGRPPARTKTLKPLPPQFKEAMERDVKAGLFKNEEEWRKALHPSIRAQHGI
jgi:hypothetical protein